MTSLYHLMLTLQTLEACRKSGEGHKFFHDHSLVNEATAESLIDVAKIELDLFIEDVRKAIENQGS